MRNRILLLASLPVLFTGAAAASTRYVKVVPADGTVLFVKRFHPPAGARLTGTSLAFDGADVTYPEVLLIRGAEGGALGSGVVVGRVQEVRAADQTAVVWPESPIATGEAYDVAIRIPQGADGLGRGSGAAIRATDVASPRGSYIAVGEAGELVPIGVDLAVELAGSASVSKSAPEAPARAGGEPALRVLRAHGGGLDIEVEVAQAAAIDVRIHDVRGRLVRRLETAAPVPAGITRLSWDGNDERGVRVASGVYFVHLRASGRMLVRQAVVFGR